MTGDGSQPSRSTFTLAVIACGFAIGYVALHVCSASYFPLPWPDESSFLWPAISLAETGSLLTPELIERHHPMWMPPGYAVVNALLFRLFGFSFDFARALSAAEMIGLFAGLVLFNRRSRAPVLSTLLCGVFLLSPYFVATGNIARMEALVLCLVGASLSLLGSGRTLAGLALLAMTPLIHPNGLYFVLAGAVFTIASPEHRAHILHPRLRSGAGEQLAAVLCLLFWLGYATYAVAQWPDFVSQMEVQFQRKMARDRLVWLMSARTLVFAISTVGCLVAGWRSAPRALLLSCFAAAAWAVSAVGLETWYHVYRELAFLLVSLAALELVCALTQSRARCRWARAAPTAALLGLLALHWAAGILPFPPGSPRGLVIHGMRPRPGMHYATDAELARVVEALSPYSDCREPVTIRTFPRADTLLLHERLERSSFRFSSPPYLLNRLGPGYGPLPWDIYLLHTIRHPSSLGLLRRFEFGAAGVDPDSSEHLLFETSDTSRWYLRIRRERIRRKCGAESESHEK